MVPPVQGGLVSPVSMVTKNAVSPNITMSTSTLTRLHSTSVPVANIRSPVVLSSGKSLLKSNNLPQMSPMSAVRPNAVGAAGVAATGTGIMGPAAVAAGLIRTTTTTSPMGTGVTIRHQVGRPLATGGMATAVRPVPAGAKVIRQATMVSQPSTKLLTPSQQPMVINRPVTPGQMQLTTKCIPANPQKSGVKVIPSQGIQKFRTQDNKTEVCAICVVGELILCLYSPSFLFYFQIFSIMYNIQNVLPS